MNRWAGVARLIGVGWYVSLCIVLPLLAGLWLDRKLGTVPLFTLLGLVLGLALALVGVYRMLSAALEKDRRGKKRTDA